MAGGRGSVRSRATRPRRRGVGVKSRGRVARDHTFSSASSVLILQAFRRSGLRALSIMIELRMTPPILRPDYREFSRLAAEATLVPVVKSVAADLLTPVSAFLAIAADAPEAFLLESVERG